MDSDMPGMIPKDQFKGTLGLRLRTAPGWGTAPSAEQKSAPAGPAAEAAPEIAPATPAPAPAAQPSPPAAGGLERMVSKLGHLFYWKKDY
jgi:hypothetical protein